MFPVLVGRTRAAIQPRQVSTSRKTFISSTNDTSIPGSGNDFCLTLDTIERDEIGSVKILFGWQVSSRGGYVDNTIHLPAEARIGEGR